jgi:hypothetical protein
VLYAAAAAPPCPSISVSASPVAIWVKNVLEPFSAAERPLFFPGMKESDAIARRDFLFRTSRMIAATGSRQYGSIAKGFIAPIGGFSPSMN